MTPKQTNELINISLGLWLFMCVELLVSLILSPQLMLSFTFMGVSLGVLLYADTRPCYYFERPLYRLTLIGTILGLLIQVLMWSVK